LNPPSRVTGLLNTSHGNRKGRCVNKDIYFHTTATKVNRGKDGPVPEKKWSLNDGKEKWRLCRILSGLKETWSQPDENCQVTAKLREWVTSIPQRSAKSTGEANPLIY